MVQQIFQSDVRYFKELLQGCLVFYRKCCNEINLINEFLNSQDPISICQVCCLLIAFERDYHGVSGAKLSGGAEMEAYGDHTAAASNQFYCKSREDPHRKP